MPDSTPVSDSPAASTPEEVRARELFTASQTFLLRTPDPRVIWLRIAAISGFFLLFFVFIPALTMAGKIPNARVNTLGQYLCFAIVALGIDLVWGYTGLLTLCQALFFALGGYAMGMHLSLKEGGGDVRPEYNNIPNFMSFNNLHELPGFWKPFASFPFAILAGLVVPMAAAGIFGFFILRSRVRGVYFSIITQALAAAAWLLMCRNEMLLGGSNGLTNFYRPMAADQHWILGLYLLTLVVLVGAFLLCRTIVRSRLGRVLIAVRDKESRLYFAGYKPYAFKVFAFSIGAMLAGIGGMLYAPQIAIVTPQAMEVRASVVMVVMVAIGGRGKLWGAAFGALLFEVAQSSLSTDFSEGWLLVEGLMAIFVVLFFPDGFAGLWDSMERQIAAGQSVLRSMITVIPLFAVGLFIGLEALGLMPAWFRGETFHPMHVPPKYWILIMLLIATALLNRQTRRRAAAASARISDLTEKAVAAASSAMPQHIAGGA